MNLNSIFYETSSDLTRTEQDIVIAALSNPTVKKYLRNMGRNDLSELANISMTEMDDSVVAKKSALVQGKLSTIATLLSIQPQE